MKKSFPLMASLVTNRLVPAGLFLAISVSSFAAAPVITTQPAAQTVFLGDPVTFSVGATGTAPLSYQWYRNGAIESGATNSSLSFATKADDDADLFSVRVASGLDFAMSSAVALTIDFGMAGAFHTNQLIAIADVWKYNVNETDLGTAWRGTAYGDSSWASGGGLLYVEESALPAPKTTLLPRVATTGYFRTWFSSAISNAYSVSLVANTVVDDGIVLYLNGTGIFTNRMPPGAISYSTLATNVGNAVYEGPFTLNAASLIAGNNLLAAEVHQSSLTSSDIVMGLTLAAVWQERLRDTAAPVVASTSPASGGTVSSLTQIQVVFNEGVRGVNASDLLINGVAATSVATNSASSYLFRFAAPEEGVVNVSWASGHGITDLSAAANAFAGAGFSYLFTPPSTDVQLEFSCVYQSSDFSPSTAADRAVDGSSSTFSLTDNLPGSYWMAELGRPFTCNRIELVNRSAPDDAEMAGLTLSVLNMDDQVVHQTVLGNPGSGGIAVVNLPTGTSARAIRIGLSGNDTNGAGIYRVGMTEVRLFGSPQIPFAPDPYISGGGNDVEITGFSVSQTTTYNNDAQYAATSAVDDNTSTFSHTDSTTPNNYWIADLAQENPIARVELVDRGGNYYTRMDNLVIRILDGSMNSVASDVVVSPGSGGTYTFSPPANTTGRYVKVGLENGEKNGRGDYVIQLAEVRIYSEAVDTTPPLSISNLASFKRSYMLRLTDLLAPASNVNDDDMSTEAVTTTQTVDGYWEVDLGGTYALYGVRAVSATAIGDRLTNCTCRLFDENHDSILEKPVTGSAPAFDIDLDGPVYARYVRVGLEDKARTDGVPGGYIGFREVEVFGRPAGEVGILAFNSSAAAVSSGENVTLDWTLEDVKRAEIHPSIGSVGSCTDTNGVGSFVRSVGASTEFIMVATNNAGIFSRAVGVVVNGAALPVVISEVVAVNKYSIEDGYGNASDWIELRNTGNSTVDLTGWGLSDNPAKPMKWVFPSTNMAPHSTLVVFASGSDVSIDPAGGLHASFSLSKEGEPIQLTKADGVTVVDSMTYPELDTDLAYGRGLDGGLAYMEPTPNAVNTGKTYAGWLKELDWSHARGFYETNFTLTVTSADPESSVFYSLDGATPSIPWSGSLAIDGTKNVRVGVSRDGYKSPRVQTKTFIFLDDVIANPNMRTNITQNAAYAARVKPGLLALPTLSISVPETPTYDEQECSLELIWPSNQSATQINCGIYRYGGAYSYFDKQSFTFAFRSKYGEGKLSAPLFNGFDHGVLAKTSFDKLELRAGNHDMSSRGFYMSDRFIQDSYLDMGSLNPHGRFVHVYMNGVYWGQYNLKEVLMENFMSDYLGGEEEDYVSVKGNDNVSGSGWVIGAGDPPNPEPWERVRALRYDYDAVKPYLDVSHYIDFMLLWGYGSAESEFRGCGPKEAGSGYKFWINDPDGFLRDTSSDRIKSTVGPGYIWQGLLAENHADFKMLLADRIYKNFFNNGAMTPAACDARLLARLDEIRDSFLAESARWSYLSPESWELKAAVIRADMFPYRTGELVTQWRANGYLPSFDPPTFNQYGGNVAEGFKPVLTSSAGTIYYTLDGTDPRLPGGAINPAALVWSAGAVTVTADVTITTRVRASDGTWSALAEPRFLLGSRQSPATGDLLVSEINYNPAGPDEYEFIEIWNSGTNLIDLSGVNISNAVRYIFPEYTTLNPGEHIVVVEDAIAFAERYQNAASPWYWDGIAVSGEWVGGLSDGGETISLYASNGTFISECAYRSDGDWPSGPDGGGSSLQLRFPTLVPKTLSAQLAYLADGRNWSASSLYHGSPGRFETAGNGVVINEMLAHTDVCVDWIELYNPGSGSVDLSNVALTDDLNWPNRYVFPNGTSIGANGYLTVSASTLGYGFSELGAEAALLELSGSNIVRIIDRVTIPAAEREEPFGRYMRSDGEIDFTELSAITPNAANAAPRVGPVVISEIMYAPNPGYAEYVEVVNISGAAVGLFDAAVPTNTWAFSGAGDFYFPQGTVLQPGEMAVLCDTNPAAFRAQYGVDAATQVFGPWSGALANEGEKLQLLYPGDPELSGFVPMYRADHVSYRTNNVWPAANSGGASLERRPLNGYGNDPVNWRASPFGGSPGFVMGDSYPMATSISVDAGSFPGISFSAIMGESYEVRYTDSLIDPDWSLLVEIPQAASNWIEVFDPAATNQQRYYRIIWKW